MNANEITPKANARLGRIQKVSRFLKVCVLLYFVKPFCVVLAFKFKSIWSIHPEFGMVTILDHPYASVSDIPTQMYVLFVIGTGIKLLGAIAFYRLLNLYERGVIFSATNVSEMKRLGIYLAGYGILAVTATVLYQRQILLPWTLLDVVLSPWIVAGVAVCIVAWIMDEGRKIQEEQALTV